jgi:HK97 family phage prohead protease
MAMYSLKSVEAMQSIMDVDVEKRTVKAVWSRLGNIDLDNDIMAAGCYNKTIQERGPKGKNQIWSLVDHKAALKYALGKPKELYIEGDMLIAVTEIVDTEIGEDAIKLYNAGCINEHSVGFQTVKALVDKSGVRTISEVILFEGSAVLFGANPETPTLGVTKSMLDDMSPETLVKRLDKLSAAFKSGTFTDQTFGLLEIEIKQIQGKILELSTKPAAKAVEPLNNDALLKALRESNSSIKNLLK